MSAGELTIAWKNMPRDEAVARLVEAHGADIHGLALRLCRNRADADELAAETFEQAWRRWETFRGDAKPSTWLYTIATRLCRRRLKREARRMPALSQIHPFFETRLPERALDGDDALSKSVRKEEIRAAEEAIASLPFPFRVALVLKDIFELPVDEVAEVLGVKENTVKTRVHRARLAVRKALLSGARSAPAPDPVYPRQMCLDLLRAKQDALDHGRGFPIGQDVVCRRCRGVFQTLDRTQDVCAALRAGQMPESVRRAMLASTGNVRSPVARGNGSRAGTRA